MSTTSRPAHHDERIVTVLAAATLAEEAHTQAWADAYQLIDMLEMRGSLDRYVTEHSLPDRSLVGLLQWVIDDYGRRWGL